MTPQTPESRAKQLAEAHWQYVGDLLKAFGVNTGDANGFNYISAFQHGYKHGVEDTRHGYPAPSMTAERYTEIHTPLPDDLVAKLAEWPCVGPAKEPILKTCATCAETGCCNTGRTLSGCSLHTPLPSEEVERINKEVAPAPLCASCDRKTCPADVMELVAQDGICAAYSSNLREQMAEAKEGNCQASLDSSQPLDLRLPTITIRCNAEEAYKKYLAERQEWMDAPDGSFDELVEKWDCLQAYQTHVENGGTLDNEGDATAMNAYHREGRPVMRAKSAMLLKNAQRGYYSPEANQIIIESNGHRFTP